MYCDAIALVTHPVQYHVPIWRCLANEVGLDVNVYYFSRQGTVNRIDPGFGRSLQWDIDLLSGYTSDFLADVEVGRFNKAKFPNPRRDLGNNFDAIVLHGYTHTFARQIIRNKRRHHYKVILRGEFSDTVDRNNGWAKKLARSAYLKWFYSQVDSFAYIGNNAREHLESRGINSERRFYSPYCVDKNYFDDQRKTIDQNTARKELGIPNDRVVLLFSGKMIPRKNPEFMAQIALNLARNPKLHLIMLGDGPLLETTKSMLSPLIAEGRATLPGFVNQSGLAIYFRAADAFVFPSKKDAWGLVTNEAMHFELPCFLSNQVGCGSDLIKPGVTGHIIEEGNIAQWCSVLEPYLDSQSKLRKMGECALKHIEPYSPSNAALGIKQAVEYACQIQAKSVIQSKT